MLSSTAAQVRIQPRMIQPRYGNTGDDHGASRSRRMTRPRLTALSATMAKAIVIETDGMRRCSACRVPTRGPRARWPATTKPLMNQRMICGRVTILVPGLRGGRCMTPGSGTSTMNPMTTVTTTKNLQNSSCIGNRATPPLMLKMVA